MKNNSPIILNCFSRGGSNILWNYFLSHPNVCHPLEETLQIFSTNIKSPRIEGLKVAWMAKRFLFNQWDFTERESLSGATTKYIDSILYYKKLKNIYDGDMKYKTEDDLYTEDEIKKTRLVIKNNNGLTFCSNMFANMYPDATFIGLIRHPIALYESHKRRQTPAAKSIDSFVEYYIKMVNKMLKDRSQISHYHIIKFEDLLINPMKSLQTLYEWAQLDFSLVKKIRLKAKPFMKKDGTHSTSFSQNKHYWFALNELNQILNTNVNKHQEQQLNNSEKEILLNSLGPTLEKLGYGA